MLRRLFQAKLEERRQMGRWAEAADRRDEQRVLKWVNRIFCIAARLRAGQSRLGEAEGHCPGEDLV
jgi:hypothetical protein